MEVMELIKNFTDGENFKAAKTIAEAFGVNLVCGVGAEDHKKINNHPVVCWINAVDAKTGKRMFSSVFTDEVTEIDEKLLLADIIAGLNYCNPYLGKTQAYGQLVEDVKERLRAEDIKERVARHYNKRK